MDKIYVNDIGTILRINCGENISSASGLTIHIKKPNGVVMTKSASLFGSNAIQYTTVAGDLDIPGTYYANPAMTLGGWTGRGSTVSWRVYEEFE